MIGLMLQAFFGWVWKMMGRLLRGVLLPWAKASARHALAAGLVSAADHTLGQTREHAKEIGALVPSAAGAPSFLQPRAGAPAPSAGSGSGLGNFLSGFDNRSPSFS